MTTRIAACACGQLRLTCEGEPALVALCNCRACQRRTGSAYGVAAYYPRAQVTGIEGVAKPFRRVSDAGREVLARFCPECGTTVYWEAAFRPGHLGVAAGAFADPDFPPPVAAVWGQHRWGWVPMPEGVPLHDAMPAPRADAP